MLQCRIWQFLFDLEKELKKKATACSHPFQSAIKSQFSQVHLRAPSD